MNNNEGVEREQPARKELLPDEMTNVQDKINPEVVQPQKPDKYGDKVWVTFSQLQDGFIYNQ